MLIDIKILSTIFRAASITSLILVTLAKIKVFIEYSIIIVIFRLIDVFRDFLFIKIF